MGRGRSKLAILTGNAAHLLLILKPVNPYLISHLPDMTILVV